MQLVRLADVRHRIRVGAPLPFGVFDAEGQLLLARGQRVAGPAQLAALCERGAVVEIAELVGPAASVRRAPRHELPRLWHAALSDIGQTLRHCDAATFRAALDDAAAPAVALIERDPDLAVFQVLSEAATVDTSYGVRRSLHAAVTAGLVAQRLHWQPGEVERAFKVALTMNVSMLELQGRLARQRTPPTAAQRDALRSHPMRSVQMLQRAGVADADWLQAVLQHHEIEDGSGYPSGRSDVCELASLARRADVYTAKLAARSTRDALAADVAGRAMFMEDPGHPMTQALVKEFGIYPPGSWVRLASGATGIVVQRGEAVTTPWVACLTDDAGAALPRPHRQRTDDGVHAVVGLIAPPRERAALDDRLLGAIFADQEPASP